jgi:aminoglycoside phosphotransferase (APT) family kinase protein
MDTAAIPADILDQLAAAGWRVRSAGPTQARGLKSDTCVVACDGGSAVLKIYNERGGAPVAKRVREWTALGALADVPFVPRPIAQGDRWLLMEQLPGRTLRTAWDGLDAVGRRRLSEDLGVAYARIAIATQQTSAHDAIRASRPDHWPDSLPDTLSAIERLLRTEERVSSPAFSAAAERIRTLAPGDPPLLVKADGNADNALVEGEAITGLVDWEQACVGDRWTWYGIVLDHAHFFDWPAVRTGLESAGGAWSRDDEERVLASGFLCVWRKIIEFDARSTWFSDPGRQVSRMSAMAAAMGRPDALPR